MRLYEIDERILSCIDQSTGEVIDQDALLALQMAREDKLEGIACWVKDLAAESKAIAEEIKVLSQRKKVAENKADSLKAFLQFALSGEKFKTSKVVVSYRKSESVVIPEDINFIPREFLKFTDPTVDKLKVKSALKAGEEIEGCYLETKQNIQIK